MAETALEHGHSWHARERTNRRLRYGVIATVVRVRLPAPATGRTALLLDVITDAARTPIFGVTHLTESGVGKHSSSFPRAAARDLRFQVGDPRRDLPTSAAMRLQVMARSESSQGWDGDKVLVFFVGEWAFAMGWQDHGRAEDDIDACQWTDGGAKSLGQGQELDAEGSPWVEGTDDLPAVHRALFAGAEVAWHGALVETRWRHHGLALELRKELAGRVTKDPLARIDLTKLLGGIRAARLSFGAGTWTNGVWSSKNGIEITGAGAVADVQKFEAKLEGAPGLVVHESIPSGTDPVVTKAALLQVVATQQAQITELQTTVNALLTVLKAASAAVNAASAGGPVPIAAAVATALTSLASALPLPASAVAPTQAEKDAIAAKNVRVATQ